MFISISERWAPAKKWKAETADTPFAKAAETIDRRDGAARVSASRAWMTACFLAITSVVSTGGWVYSAFQAGRVAAFYVPVDEAGRPGRVVPAEERYTPKTAEVQATLGNLIREAFSRPSDGKVFGDQVRHAVSMLVGDAKTTFNKWAAENRIDQNIGVEMRAIDGITILQTASPDTYRAEWIESTWRDGTKRSEQRMTGLLTVMIIPPVKQDTLFSNPLGVYVKSLSWQRS